MFSPREKESAIVSLKGYKLIQSLKEHPFTAFERLSLFTKCSPVGDHQGRCDNKGGACHC